MPEAIERARERFFLEARKRRAKALKLHQDGKSFAEIGELFGVTRQRAGFMVKKARAENGATA